VATALVLLAGVVVVITRDAGCAAFVTVLQEPADRGQPGVLDRSGGHSVYDVIALTSDLSTKRRLTHGALAEDPSFSPDGKRIAYADGRGYAYDPEAGPAQTSIYLVDTDGSHDKRLTHGDDMAPAWSPDGSRIAFLRTSADRKSTGLWTVDLATGHETELETGAFERLPPLWSPDGRVAAYVENGLDVSLVSGGHQFGLRGSVSRVVWNATRTAYAFTPVVHGSVQVLEVKSGQVTTVPNTATTLGTVGLVGWTSDDNLLIERPVRAGLVDLLVSQGGRGRPHRIGHWPSGEPFINFADNPACSP
jgi:dipeptidyl aminopeptidase/acylaminoacyl peptidase